MSVKGAVWGTITCDEILELADKLEALTLEESLDPDADHARQVWSAAGLRELCAMRARLDKP